LRRHSAFLVLLVAAGTLEFAFASQGRIASFGDDSVSYLVLANYFAGSSGDAFAAQWAPYHSHFPPLLPALLWLSGGVHDYRVAYAVVAGLSVLALPLVYRFASRELGGEAPGLAVVLAFVLMPTAWITLKGIMSESLYLFLAMASLAFFQARVEGREASPGDRLAFGLLLGLACLSRALGVALVLAYGAHCAVRLATGREKPRAGLLVPLAPVGAMLAAWYVLRPTAGSDAYLRAAAQVLAAWREDPAPMLVTSLANLASGWIASFSSQAHVSSIVDALALAVGAAALAGTALRLRRNRLDAWFVLASVAIVVPWVFSVENTRRLIYPLLPLLLLAAGDLVRWGIDRAAASRWSRAQVAAIAFAVPVVASLPALVLVARKASDADTVIPGYAYTYREVAEYYTTVDVKAARDRAKLAVVTLGGLESLEGATPPGSRVMWMRPEYVGVLGHREGIPFLYRWTPVELAREVKRTGTDYILQTWLFKTDLEVAQGNPRPTVSAYTHRAFGIGDIFLLLRVDRAALDAYLQQAGGAR